MKYNFDTALLFPTATCNLRCKYCNIDKNHSLIEIDKLLEESFSNVDYYLNKFTKYFPFEHSLKLINFWGGEPSFKLERVFPLLRELVKRYPYFSTVFMSTNFSFLGWENKIMDLILLFEDFPERNFNIIIQLSCDGPTYINDAGRGIGTTEKSFRNLNKLIERLKQHCLTNVTLIFQNKPTLDIETIKLLSNEEKIIEYYNFFEQQMFGPLAKLQEINSRIKFFPCNPNLAMPLPASSKDGKQFTEFCKMCRELEEKPNNLKFYSILTPFGRGSSDIPITYYDQTIICGSGSTMLGFLPNNLIATCNEGFVHLSDNYDKEAKNAKETKTTTIDLGSIQQKNCLTEQEFEEYMEQVASYNNAKNSSLISSMAVMISSLGLCGQIDKKYAAPEEAVKAARFIKENVCFCVKDNYNVTGSMTLVHCGIYRMLLNGALDYLMR